MTISNTRYGISLGLRSIRYIMKNTLRVINTAKVVTGTDETIMIKTKMNFRKYFTASTISLKFSNVK